MHIQPAPAYLNTLITVAVLAVVVLLRVRTMRRARRLRLERLWVVPALYAAVTAVALVEAPPRGWLWAGLALALAAGALIGWRRGALMRITIDPETHALNQQASPLAMVLILALVLVRQGLRQEALSYGFDAARVTDALMVFALGLFAATRAEMYLRARRMLAGVRGA